MDIYICYTLYQLIMASIICQQRENQEKKLLILAGENLKQYEKNEALRHLYDEIVWIDILECENKKKEYFFSPEKGIEYFLKKKLNKINQVFYYNNHGILEYLYKYCKQNRWNTIFNLYEESLSIYRAEELIKKEVMYLGGRRYKLLNKIIWKYRPSKVPTRVWISNPNLYLGTGKYEVCQIDSYNATNTIKLFRNIWSDIRTIEQKYIFLGDVCDIYQDFEWYNNMINEVAEIVGQDNLIYKPHPRAPIKGLEKNINVYEENIPWEVYALTQNMDDKTIICGCSNAGYIPSITFGKRIKTISLIKLCKKHYSDQSIKDVFLQTLENVIAKDDDIITITDLIEIKENGGEGNEY